MPVLLHFLDVCASCFFIDAGGAKRCWIEEEVREGDIDDGGGSLGSKGGLMKFLGSKTFISRADME